MGYFATAADLKKDGLFLAGEPDDGNSQYDSRAYEWLTVIERALISGGQFGPSTVVPYDWLWARAWPRGAIQLSQPANADHTVTATFQTGSRYVTTAPMMPDGTDLSGYRIQQDATPARHLVTNSQNDIPNNQTLITLTELWTGATMSTAS